MRKALSIAIIFMLFAAAAAYAVKPGEPRPQMFPEISTADVKKKLDAREKFFLVDARPEQEYAAGHLPGAVNVPPEKLQSISGNLPKDKGALVVFYCRGYG